MSCNPSGDGRRGACLGGGARWAVAVAVALALAGAGCGAEPGAPSQAELVSSFESKLELARDDASCVARRVVELYDDGELEVLRGEGAGGLPPRRQTPFVQAVIGCVYGRAT